MLRFCGALLNLPIRLNAKISNMLSCASISLHGWGDTQRPINPPTTVLLSFTFILPPPGTVQGLTAGVEQSHELNLNLRFTLL